MPADERARPEETLTVRNTARRPITFRVAGKTIRLGPGESRDVPKDWLGSTELRRFCGAGLVSPQAAVPKRRADEKAEEPTQPKPDKPKTRKD